MADELTIYLRLKDEASNLPAIASVVGFKERAVAIQK
jgi:hypothetical protein